MKLISKITRFTSALCTKMLQVIIGVVVVLFVYFIVLGVVFKGDFEKYSLGYAPKNVQNSITVKEMKSAISFLRKLMDKKDIQSFKVDDIDGNVYYQKIVEFENGLLASESESDSLKIVEAARLYIRDEFPDFGIIYKEFKTQFTDNITYIISWIFLIYILTLLFVGFVHLVVSTIRKISYRVATNELLFRAKDELEKAYYALLAEKRSDSFSLVFEQISKNIVKKYKRVAKLHCTSYSEYKYVPDNLVDRYEIKSNLKKMRKELLQSCLLCRPKDTCN